MPDLLAKILTALILLIIAAPIGWLAVRWPGRHSRAARRRRMSEPLAELGGTDNTRGVDCVIYDIEDTQGRAPETGSGLRAGEKS